MSADDLLARVTHEIERISDQEHALARRKVALREAATRLRLGANPFEIRERLRALDAMEVRTP